MPHDLLLLAMAVGPVPSDAPFGPITLRRALDGDRVAQRALFDALLPHLQRRITAALLRAHGVGITRQQVLDFTQDVCVSLFENDCRALRRWRPDGGATLPTWVGRIAEHQIASALRTARRNPWTEVPSSAAAIARQRGSQASAHAAVSGRDQLARVLDALRVELSPLGYGLFVALYVDEQTVDAVSARFEMTPNAVYVWRTRLRKAARAAMIQVNAEGAPTEGVGS